MQVSLLAAWLHDLSPFLVRLWGNFGLRWYGLSYAAGFFAAWVILRWLIGRGAAQVPRSRSADAIILMAIGAVVGGRLGYALIYRRELFWTFSSSLPFWELLDVTQGGMASHGGMIGVMLAAWRVSRGFRVESGQIEGRTSLLHIFDLATLMAPVGLFLGRLANFVNGELLGRVVAAPGEPSPWWSVKFPQEVLSEHAPALTIEQERSLVDLVGDVSHSSDTFAQGYERLVERIQRGAPELAQRLEPLLAARHPSQIYQAVAEGIIVGTVVWCAARRPRRPGVVSAWFLISYGVMRVVTEVWRLPDAHFSDPTPLGLSRGQWLSVAMVGAGVVLLARVRVRGGEAMGGWGRRASRAGATPDAGG